MGRWTQYDEDSYRLPHGMRRIGYDADSGIYTFKDEKGHLYQSEPHNQYGVFHRVKAPRAVQEEEVEEEYEWSDEDEELPPYSERTKRAMTSFNDILAPAQIGSASGSHDRRRATVSETGRPTSTRRQNSSVVAPESEYPNSSEHTLPPLIPGRADAILTDYAPEMAETATGTSGLSGLMRRATMPTKRARDAVQSLVRAGTSRRKKAAQNVVAESGPGASSSRVRSDSKAHRDAEGDGKMVGPEQASTRKDVDLDARQGRRLQSRSEGGALELDIPSSLLDLIFDDDTPPPSKSQDGAFIPPLTPAKPEKVQTLGSAHRLARSRSDGNSVRQEKALNELPAVPELVSDFAGRTLDSAEPASSPTSPTGSRTKTADASKREAIAA